jgi:hypothetical protein
VRLTLGAKILVARPGYYPVLIRATVAKLHRYGVTCWRSYDKTADQMFIRRNEEGRTWCRGHDRHSPAAHALEVVASLSYVDTLAD